MNYKMKTFTELSSDIENSIFDINIEKIKSGEYEIDSIIDVFYGEEIEQKLTESGIIGIPTDLSNKDVKRGDVIYITAMLRKTGSTNFYSPSVASVLKLRIVDIFHGLSYLNKVLK